MVVLVILQLVILRRLFAESKPPPLPPQTPRLISSDSIQKKTSQGVVSFPNSTSPFTPLAQRSGSLRNSRSGDFEAQSSDEEGDDSYSGNVSDRSLEYFNDPGSPDFQSPFLGRRKPIPVDNGSILVVDDNSINQMLSTKMLQRYFADVNVASNGQQALDMLQNPKKNYKAVFLDIAMPVMDGLSCAKLIRAMPRYRRVPIIIVSAHLDMVKAGDLITDTIPKPVSLGDFENIIDKLKLLDMNPILHEKFE